MTLKAVIFALEGVLTKNSAIATESGFRSERSDAIQTEIAELFAFLRAKCVRPIVLSNRDWTFHRPDGSRVSLDDGLRAYLGEHRLYVATRGDVPFKPTKECIPAVLAKEGLAPEEVVMVGMSEKDFRTAVNAQVLFLNAVWDRREVDHGFVFEAPWEIRRFIDLFALRSHPWFYAIDDPVRYRSLAPYSTFSSDTEAYSRAAEAAAKRATADRHFFLNMLVSSLYFSGLAPTFSYVAAVPGHRCGFGNPAMDDNLATLGNIFRKNYLRDLIVRHTDAPSSRQERIARRTPQATAQFNSIHLSRYPLKKGAERYKSAIALRGKTVLVIDDFATGGLTLEAARHYLVAAGADALLVSWLKTINRGYHVVTCAGKFDPYAPAQFDAAQLRARELPYARYIAEHDAPIELKDAFDRYRRWRA